MPEVFDWQKTSEPGEVIQRALQALADGNLVGFPTETVYGIACSLGLPEAVQRLAHCKGRPDDKPMTLAVAGIEEALPWVPGMSQLGRRFARRCWPGPVTLVFSQGLEQSRIADLPQETRQRICPRGTLGLRAPAHLLVLEVLRALGGPLVLTSANRSGEPEATSAEQVLETVGHQLAVVVDDGPSRLGQASTVVQVNGSSWKVLREGVVPAATLRLAASCWIVFVCTGNTCRSPMAEVLFKKMLAEKLGCPVEDLAQHGYVVLSAGLAAILGARAAEEAVETVHELGADLSNHCSQPLTPDLLAQADFVFVMTENHRNAVEDLCGPLGPQTRLLSPEGIDIPDPVGCEKSVYQECAQQILRSLEALWPEVEKA